MTKLTHCDLTTRHSLGKGEVDSSILSGSTIPCTYPNCCSGLTKVDFEHLGCVCPEPLVPAETGGTEREPTITNGENPWSLFGTCSALRERGHDILAAQLWLAKRYPASAALLTIMARGLAKETKIGP